MNIISHDKLKTYAGERDYKLGLVSFERAKVENFHQDDFGARGIINGYEPKLSFRGDHIEGACTCPSSDGFDFCQHCVHLALHANRTTQQLFSLSKGPDKSKVMAYLLSLDKQVLAKQMLAQLETDEDQFKRYLLRASLLHDQLDAKRLKSQITQLTKANPKLFSQRQVKHFYLQIEQFVSEISQLDEQMDPELSLKLAEYTLQRLNQLLDKQEDRHNLREKSVSLLIQWLGASLLKLLPHPEEAASRFQKAWQSDLHQLIEPEAIYTFYGDQADAFKDFFEKLVVAVWKNPGKLKSVERTRAKLARYLLSHDIELAFDEQQACRHALRTTQDDLIHIAELWRAEGELKQAFNTLNDGLKEFPNSERILETLATLVGEHESFELEMLALFKTHPKALYAQVTERAQTQRSALVNDELIEDILKCQGQLSLLFSLYLRTQRFKDAALLLPNKAITRVQQVAFAAAAVKEYPDFSLKLLKTEIEALLQKDMLSADKEAARLFCTLEQAMPQSAHLKDLETRLRPLINRRPKFSETYHELMARHGQTHRNKQSLPL